MKLEDYAQKYKVTNDGVQYSITGLTQAPDFYPYKNSFQVHIIKPENAYRPDKIANQLWGDPKLDWVLDLINFFYSESEYYPQRSINFVSREILHQLGIV